MKNLIKSYKLNTKKINDKLIISISDIHYDSKNDIKKLNNIKYSIEKIKPSFICIVGDLIDKPIINDEDLLINWLKELSKISEVIISLGNHDYIYSRNKGYFYNEKFFSKIKKIKGVKLLDNEVYTCSDINFIGITNSIDYYKSHESVECFIKEVSRLKLNFDKNNYNILLCHSPIAITESKVLKNCSIFKNIDLVLCGHMHAGIVPNILRPLLKNRGFISPSKKKLFINNAYGYLCKNNIDFVISGGITKASKTNPFSFLDIFFYREIVKIEIKSDK